MLNTVGSKFYRRFFRTQSVSKFKSKIEVEEFLFDNVFQDKLFIKHVTKASEDNNVSYVIAYNVITTNLIDSLYEVDKAISFFKKKSKILFHSYFSLQIGFMLSTENKKMFLEKLINLKFEKNDTVQNDSTGTDQQEKRRH